MAEKTKKAARAPRTGRFAHTIRARLADLGWSQRDLATRLGKDICYVNHMLSKPMSERNFLRCCDVLGLEIDTFQVWRPSPPFTEYEKHQIVTAAESARKAGGEVVADKLLEMLSCDHTDRSEFNRRMAAAQKYVYAGRIRACGYDPDFVLGASWS